MGTLYDSGIARLEGIRRSPVNGFEKYLVFYLPHVHGIDVIRILHGARDIDSLFAEEEA
jgi:toxin ParE1/3/4